MDNDEERRILTTAQAQEWARRHVDQYQPPWTGQRVFLFCLLAALAGGACAGVWFGLIK